MSDFNNRLTNEYILRLNKIEGQLKNIELRNHKVESNKDWETSKVRVFSITILTYLVMVLTMRFLNFTNPFAAALIPALGYFLSTLSLGVIRRRFIDKLDK